MKKQLFVFAMIALLVSVFIFIFISNVQVIDISGYEKKYQYTFNNIEDCVTHSNMAVIAEYVNDDTAYYCRFTVKECLYGDDIFEDEDIHVRIPEKPDYSIENLGSGRKGNPNADYRGTNWYRTILLVDLIPGEEYLIIGEFGGKYTFDEENPIERCEQYLILYPDYPFTEEEFKNGEVENQEDYVTALEYVKYIDKRYGHGSKEW